MKPSQLIPFGQVDDAYDKLYADLEFAYKRAKVLADMLKIPVHESPEVTGTILGLVRGSIERMQVAIKVAEQQRDDRWIETGLMSEQKRNDLLYTENERLRSVMKDCVAGHDDCCNYVCNKIKEALAE